MTNRVVWFDIPVVELARATEFYSKVLDVPVKGAHGVAVLEHDGDDVAGCLIQSDDEKPSGTGLLLYFNVSGRLDAATLAAEQFGGKILKAKEAIGQFGYRTIVLDSEGNRIALHSD